MHEHTVRVANDGHVAEEVTIEPWGGSHWIQPGEALEVVGTGPEKGRLRLDDSQGIRSVWAWSGATVRVLQDGKLLEDYTPPAP
jgi:hypothetical protein